MPPYGMGAPFPGGRDRGLVEIPPELEGLMWLLPGTGAHVDPPGYMPCAPTASASAVLTGAPSARYQVTVRFRGIVEQQQYVGGLTDGHWQVGGVAGGDPAWNVYSVDISSPRQRYYLNQGPSALYSTIALDITRTFEVDTGATVSILADSRNSQEIINTTGSIGGIATPAQPYDGQFIVATVLSITRESVGNGTFISDDGDLMGYGTYLSRPAAGTAGRTWHASDQPYASVDDGSAWRPRVHGVLCKECPALAGFTARNIGSDVWTESGGRYVVDAASRGGSEIAGYTKAPTSTSAFTVTVGAQFFSTVTGGGSPPGGCYQHAGACVRDAGGAFKSVTLGVYQGSTRDVVVESFSAAGTRTAFDIYQAADARFVRVRHASGTSYFEVSPNLKDWITVASAAFTPTEAGITVGNEGGGATFEVFHVDIT